MNRWGRIVWSLAALASAAWISGGLLGYRIVDAETLARHTLVAFSALLALALTHLWVAVYLVVLERLMRRGFATSAAATRALTSARRRGVAAAAVAVFAPVAQFTSANALYPSRLDAGWHAVAGLLTAIALGVALGLERRALRDAGGAAAEGGDEAP